MLNGSLLKINLHDVTHAFDRLCRFQTVNSERENIDEMSDGLNNYCESVGLDATTFTIIFERCEDIWGEDAAPLMCIAVLLGLSMAESYLDKHDN